MRPWGDHDLQEVVGHVFGVVGDELDPFETFRVVERGDEIRKPPSVPS